MEGVGGRTLRVERRSELAVPPELAWEWATSPELINEELRPVLRMTMPAPLRDGAIDPASITLGEPLGRSWILLFGLIPADFDDLCIAELDPPRRFLERSRTLNFDPWIHERAVEPSGVGCVLTDRLAFELRRWPGRVPSAGRLALAAVGALFSHRHRRLRRRASAADPGAAAG